ncbi:MAG: hypothetical protein ABIH23_18570, partial [bacterium]
AIDPSISLANLAQRKPVWDPGATFDRAMSLRDLMDKRRVQEAALQREQIEGKLKKIELEDERQVRRTVGRGGTLEEVKQNLRNLPGSAGLKRASAMSAEEEADFKAQSEQLNLQMEKIRAMSSILGAVLDAPDPGRYFPAASKMAKSMALVDQNFPEDYDSSMLPQLQQYRTAAQTTEQQITQAQKVLDYKRTVAENAPKQLSDWWKTSSQILGTAQDEQEWQTGIDVLTESGVPPHMPKAIGAFSPENKARIESIGLTPQERATRDKEKTKTESQWVQDFAKGDPNAIAYFQAKRKIAAADSGAITAAKTQAELGGLNMPTTRDYTGIAFGESVEIRPEVLEGQPPGVRETIMGMVDGRKSLPGGAAMKTGYWQNMVNLAMLYDPSFDESQWKVRLDTRVDFAKGNASRQLRSLNTLLKHTGSLWKAIEALDNNAIKATNWVSAEWAEQLGTERAKLLKDYDNFAEMVASEMAALLKGGSAAPSEKEIEAQKKIHNRNESIDVQKTAVRGTIEGAFGRLDGIKNQFENAFRKAPDFRFASAPGRAVIKMIGLNPDELDPGKGNAEPPYLGGSPSGDPRSGSWEKAPGVNPFDPEGLLDPRRK